MAEDRNSEAQDRTEPATPRRLQKAREDGQVALSREVAGLGSLAGGVLGLMLAVPFAAEMMLGFRGMMARAHMLDPAVAAGGFAWLGGLVLLPVALLAGGGAVAATLLQTRGLVSAKGLQPRLHRLSPLAAIKRIFGVEGAIEFLRTVIKLGFVGAALWWALGDTGQWPGLMQLPAAGLLAHAGRAALDLALAALVAFAGIAALDWLLVRQRHLHQLRMSRQDLREEMRESEGDPYMKGRLRQLRQARSRSRMIAAVPKAAVVITNPTHYAVALAYDQGAGAAPRIVAKGADAVAARIRAAAEAARVPIVSNPPLARALFRLELETEIPPEHYQAVAEIIAYVWRLGGGGRSG